MNGKKRSIITIETHKLTVVRQSRKPIKIWCEQCTAQVSPATPEDVAMFLSITVREVYRRIEQGALHSFEKEDGSLFVCCDQLKKRASKNEQASCDTDLSL